MRVYVIRRRRGRIDLIDRQQLMSDAVLKHRNPIRSLGVNQRRLVRLHHANARTVTNGRCDDLQFLARPEQKMASPRLQPDRSQSPG